MKQTMQKVGGERFVFLGKLYLYLKYLIIRILGSSINTCIG